MEIKHAGGQKSVFPGAFWAAATVPMGVPHCMAWWKVDVSSGGVPHCINDGTSEQHVWDGGSTGIQGHSTLFLVSGTNVRTTI